MLGAARQGQAVIRYSVGKGARVILSDMKSFDKLISAQEALKDLSIRWVTGSHPLELLDETDIICVTGGVDLQIPILKEASDRNIPIVNDTQVFLSIVKAPVIGITGSSGKTTTTTLVGRIAEFASNKEQKVWVGGNIGNPLLTFSDDICPNDIVILELSSFQLDLTTVSPKIAAILNITPNHLDRHGTMEAYITAKKHIINYQDSSDFTILNRDDRISWNLRHEIRGRLISFGFEKPSDLSGRTETTVIYLENETIRRYSNHHDEVLLPIEKILLRGRHNISNVMAACAIATAAGFSPEAMQKGVEGFIGVGHRLQWVRELRGTNWYNDSIATSPERTLAAIHSFNEPLVLLLGGRDKHLPWEELAVEVHKRAHAVVLFGESAPLIETALENKRTAGNDLNVLRCGSLKDAVEMAASLSKPGDVVLLSPGGTSYDAFNDFEERGKAFIEWVLQLK